MTRNLERAKFFGGIVCKDARGSVVKKVFIFAWCFHSLFSFGFVYCMVSISNLFLDFCQKFSFIISWRFCNHCFPFFMIFVNLLAKQIATTKVFNKNIQICKYFLFTIIIEAFNDLIRIQLLYPQSADVSDITFQIYCQQQKMVLKPHVRLKCNVNIVLHC